MFGGFLVYSECKQSAFAIKSNVYSFLFQELCWSDALGQKNYIWLKIL